MDDPKAETAKFEDFSLFYVPEKGGYLVGDYKGPLSSIVVPDEATGEDGVTRPIIGLADYAFNGRSKITTVLLGENVTTIGDYAFYESGISDLRIAGCLNKVGDHAFDGSKVTFYENAASQYQTSSVRYLPSWTEPYWIAYCGGEDVHQKLESSCQSVIVKYGTLEIAEHAFAVDGLKSVVIPSSVTKIGSNAFGGCSFSSIELPPSLTSIGENAFSLCSSLKSLKIPSSVTEIGAYAFSRCASLKSIELPSSLTSIGNWVFNECEALESVTIPSSVTSIGTGAFGYCTALSSVEIQGPLTSIGDSAFRSCFSLTKMVLPSSLRRIGSYAFSRCYNMPSIIVPLSVSSIGDYAFSGCSSLTIYFEAETIDGIILDGNWNDSNRPFVLGYKG